MTVHIGGRSSSAFMNRDDDETLLSAVSRSSATTTGVPSAPWITKDISPIAGARLQVHHLACPEMQELARGSWLVTAQESELLTAEFCAPRRAGRRSTGRGFSFVASWNRFHTPD